MITKRHSLRRLRLAAAAGRFVLCGLAFAGLAASARFLVAPPRPIVRTVAAAPEDRAAQAAATAFARAYLTLDGQRPDDARAALGTMTGDEGAALVAPDVPALVRQRVHWVDVVSDRIVAGRTHAVVVAADTDRQGVVHLAIELERRRDGTLRIVGAPALVGGPVLAAARDEPDGGRVEVADAALTDVCRRALENYLAGNARNLAADLAVSASVSLPDVPLRLERMESLRWTVDRRSVAATVQASDRDGVRYRLRYALDVVRDGARWLVRALATDPDA